jgi:hypothetical protein
MRAALLATAEGNEGREELGSRREAGGWREVKGGGRGGVEMDWDEGSGVELGVRLKWDCNWTIQGWISESENAGLSFEVEVRTRRGETIPEI